MKKIVSFLRNTLPYLCIAMFGMYVVFYAIDFVNPIMNFIYHNMTLNMLLILGCMGLVLSIILISGEMKALKRSERRKTAK